MELSEHYLREQLVNKLISGKELAKKLNIPVYMIRNRVKKYKLSKEIKMAKLLNEIDKSYFNLTVKEFVSIENEKSVFKLECRCGNFTTAILSSVKSGFTKSCGCLKSMSSQKNGRNNWNGYGELSGTYYSRIKSRASKIGKEFNVTIEYLWDLFIKQNRLCNLSKREIILTKSRSIIKSTASLDRIDSSKGYIEGNVQWVHKDINHMKMQYNQEYFINICKDIANNN